MIKKFLLFVLIISMFYMVLKVANSNFNSEKPFRLNENMKKDISILLQKCKKYNMKKYSIENLHDYKKYMNNISCICSGIGYWGGFCLRKQNKNVGGNEYHDKGLAYILADLYKNKTVVDLGSGLGWYCPIISKKSKKCDQYDGSVNIEEVTDGKVKYLNLAEPIKFKCKYDVVISLEVAEHIPKKYEEIYVNNLIKCSRDILLITWSRIGQRGHFHVNNKNRDEVIKIFESKGLKFSNNTTNLIMNYTKISWLKNNMLFFTKNKQKKLIDVPE